MAGYLTSIGSYYTFYLIQKFHVSVRDAQLHLFLFHAAVAVGTFLGGPLGDRIGRKYVIRFSILGALPFTLAMPFANLFWTGMLSVAVGLVMASAFAAIVVYGQELVPGRLGMIAGILYGLSFGTAAVGAALLVDPCVALAHAASDKCFLRRQHMKYRRLGRIRSL
ncbi:MAG TPA: MFS transporter [Rhizomicrobium sp.]|nr:MFS transporter [Rhizomicrobium sp.]